MNTRLPRILFGFFLIFFSSFSAYPQAIELEVWDDSDGLSQGTVYAMCQGKEGFSWLGTEYGLNRFDGNDFLSFTYTALNPEGIKNGQIHALLADRQGYIWIGLTGGAGINRFDPASQTFLHIPHDTLIPTSLSNGNVYSLLEDKEGNIWAGTLNGLNKISKVTQDSFVITSYFPNSTPNEISFAYGIQDLCFSQQGDIWVATRKGLYLFSPVSESFTYVSIQNTPLGISSVLEDARGSVWAGSNEGLFYRKPGEDAFVSFDYSSGLPPEARFHLVTDLMEDSQKRLWVGTDYGVVMVDPKLDSLIRFRPDLEEPFFLPSGEVHSLSETQEGQIMIGFEVMGVGLLSFKAPKFYQSHFLKPFDSPGIPKGVRAFYQLNESEIWVGTEYHGIFRLHWENGIAASSSQQTEPRVVERISQQTALPKRLNSEGAISFYQDGKGALWIGTNSGGVNILTPEGDMRYYPHNPDDPYSIGGNRVSVFLLGKDSTLWVGCWGGGLNKVIFPKGRWGYDSLQFQTYQHDPNDPASIGHPSIRCMTEDGYGNLWMGFMEAGIDKFDPRQEKFFHFPPGNLGDSTKLMGGYFMGIQVDDSGFVWASGTGGYHRIDPQTHLVEHFPFPEEIGPGSAFLFFDKKGNIWGKWEKAIKFNPQTQKFTTFGKADGVSTDGCGSCAYQSPDGWIFMAFPLGFNYFHPDSIQLDVVTPRVNITHFDLFNESIEIGQRDERGNVILPRAIHTLDELTLHHDQSVFTFHFSALHYYHPEDCKYAYRMEGLQGFEERWVETGAENRSATFTGLKPGTYTFEVKASNHDGVWSKTPTALRIRVLPPWWQTAWAYLAYALALGALAFVVVRIFVVRERMRNEVAMKSQEARQLAELDRMRSRFFANISHEFRTPLTLILGPLEDKLAKQDLPEDDRLLFRSMRRNARRLLGLINQLLDLSRLEAGQLQLNARPGDLAEDLRQMAGAFDSAADQKQIDFQVDIPVMPFMAVYDREKIETIVNNLLGNAFKFAATGDEVRLALRLLSPAEAVQTPESSTVLLSVSDTGPGISPEKLPHIFERFYQADDTATRAFEGSGIGLALTRELVEMHGGKIEVGSELGKGTSFRVWLPLEVKQESTKKTVQPSGANLAKASEKADPRTWEADLSLSSKNAPTILLVEDNADLRAYLRRSLKDTYQLLEAENGRIGLEIAIGQVPDLIISDVMMPEMDGFAFCAAAKTDERTSHIPVILLTALADRDNRIEGLETGADDYLAKPFDARELLVRVTNLIEQRKRLREKYQKQSPLSPREVAVTSADERFLEKVSKVLEENFGDAEFSVEAFADEMALSRMQLHRKLKALTDQSASDLLKQYRLQRAAQLLKQEHASVSEIAFMVGFSTASLFSRSFKELYGVSPSEFKG